MFNCPKILAAIVAMLLVSPTATSAEQQENVASFDFFNYTGNDDYYNTNPLTSPEQFYNPILPGWYSDPTICTNGEGDYFLATSTFTYFPGVPLFHSRDLVNWEQVGYVLSRESQLQNMKRQHVSGGIYAPALSYNPASKTYYMVTTNVGAGNFFVKTTDPFGEWSDPIMLPEVQGIDPAFFFDTDGRAYIVNNDEAPDGKAEYDGHRTVRVVEFDTATDKCIGERKIVVNKGWRPQDKPIWCEGPHIYKINNVYYLMTAEGGTAEGHSEVIYRGPSPFGPFEPYQGNPILTQRSLDSNRANPVTCAGHADIIQTKEGDWWAVFLACRPNAAGYENLGRETFMLPVSWTTDGWPIILPNGKQVPLIESRKGVKRGESVTFGNFSSNDDFNSATLGQEWLTLRGDAKEYYSLTSPKGQLSIKCAPVSSNGRSGVLPYVGRRVQHHKYIATTRMTFQPQNEAEKAGLMILKDETHQYLLARGTDSDGEYVELLKVGRGKADAIAKKNISKKCKTVDLKVESTGETLDFKYSTDKGRHWKTLADGVDARYTSTSEAGGFTGTTIGMYATNKKY